MRMYCDIIAITLEQAFWFASMRFALVPMRQRRKSIPYVFELSELHRAGVFPV
jgi:hypothetical protein